MKTWTATIALVAYVVGGWLLPATHHHDHACAHQIVDSSAPECSHSACQHKPVKKEAPASDAANWIAFETATCPGLCALCSARTLSTIRPVASTAFSEADCPLQSYLDRGVHWPLPIKHRAHQKRGPPTIA